MEKGENYRTLFFLMVVAMNAAAWYQFIALKDIKQSLAVKDWQIELIRQGQETALNMYRSCNEDLERERERHTR